MTYWDFVTQAVEESPVPYVSLALRSDQPDRSSNQTVRRVLTALTQHPLSKRLAIVDPVVFAKLPQAGA
jgi:hypothetical protein